MATETSVERRASGASEAMTPERTRSGRTYTPPVDILETRDELLLCADIPGACGPDIDINFENGLLTIYAPAKERQPQDTSFLIQEYGVGDYFRSFQISEEVDSERISAECSNGVLVLHLPKVEAAKPRKIVVNAK